MHSFFKTLVRTFSFEDKASVTKPNKTINVQVVECARFPVSQNYDHQCERNSEGPQEDVDTSKLSYHARSGAATWDKKRAKCKNCKHIYLITLSRHIGYCSVDCKSNAVYLQHVNRLIEAVQSAAKQENEISIQNKLVEKTGPNARHSPAEMVHAQQMLPENITLSAAGLHNSNSFRRDAHSFGEFGLEDRGNDLDVQWAFSAMY
uniref:Uncharacterized protein AlNc14C183G8271 n=1 Tax=Albugo laibachii Nc14 TaxID=890382 RepID=F0W1U4_9STRA|nr:conserved hypothetical protein [Albugo laibachii Nc14]CCA23172.1 conserved hypothetical protein [Albugo laibachii Nc14]|eukprot:CCA23172.1 conserved hypothetical protein [Albugo laibachii Nc14]